MAYFETHNFYCLKCGNPSIPIMRKSGQFRGKFHRKKLYCPHCQCEVNHAECRNDNEVWEFKQKFENGDFEKEARKSIEYIKEEGGILND